ncbi:MAG TPA: lysylphosphatidylglycerol synthase transmembrane domain-containing protein [Thermomicrobiales bacterium]|nr:lysylphosphatidylglycerol synthase transmembrane domain-containing protein [Thermomicrobiales bacterium]
MRSWRAWVGIAISTLFLWLAFRGQDLGEIRDALRQTNLWWVVPALLLYFTGVWVRAMRWQVLMRPLAPVSARDLFPVAVVGYMANNVLPLRAGELVRSVVIGQRFGVRKTSTLATIAVERLFDGLTMLGFMLLATTVVSFTSELQNLAIIAFVLFAVLLIGLFALTLGGSVVDRLLQLVLGPMPTALADRVERMAESFLSGLGIFRSRSDFLKVAGLSVTAWLFEASTYWVLAIGFGGTMREIMGWAETLMTTGVANMATLIPSSPGYIGQFEYGVKLVLNGALGVADGPALAYAILVHAVLYFPITLWGAWEWFRQHLSWKAIQESGEGNGRTAEQPVLHSESPGGNA